MLYELIFRGSLVQYWNKIRAEWQRPSRKGPLAQEPFRLSHPHPPEEFEEVTIEFLDEQYRLGLVTVDALSGADGKSVKLIVHIEREAYKESGKSALSKWNKMKSAWERKGWLIDPLAQLHPKKTRGMLDKTKDNLKRLREYRCEYMNANGKAPTKADAMRWADISYHTCKTYASQLLKFWKDKEYE